MGISWGSAKSTQDQEHHPKSPPFFMTGGCVTTQRQGQSPMARSRGWVSRHGVARYAAAGYTLPMMDHDGRDQPLVTDARMLATPRDPEEAPGNTKCSLKTVCLFASQSWRDRELPSANSFPPMPTTFRAGPGRSQETSSIQVSHVGGSWVISRCFPRGV